MTTKTTKTAKSTTKTAKTEENQNIKAIDSIEKFKVETRPIDFFKPYKSNARTHGAAQIQAIAASIRRFGFTLPILATENGEMIAGHGRFLAAQSIGLKILPVRIISDLSDLDRRAYIIADNRLAELAGWDVDLLSSELAELNDSGFDDLTLTGFDDQELAELLDGLIDPPETREPTDPENDSPEPDYNSEDPVSQKGEIWVLGSHRLTIGGDDRDIADWLICAWQKKTKQTAVNARTGDSW
jgi:hypothetical protein